MSSSSSLSSDGRVPRPSEGGASRAASTGWSDGEEEDGDAALWEALASKEEALQESREQVNSLLAQLEEAHSRQEQMQAICAQADDCLAENGVALTQALARAEAAEARAEVLVVNSKGDASDQGTVPAEVLAEMEAALATAAARIAALESRAKGAASQVVQLRERARLAEARCAEADVSVTSARESVESLERAVASARGEAAAAGRRAWASEGEAMALKAQLLDRAGDQGRLQALQAELADALAAVAALERRRGRRTWAQWLGLAALPEQAPPSPPPQLLAELAEAQAARASAEEALAALRESSAARDASATRALTGAQALILRLQGTLHELRESADAEQQRQSESLRQELADARCALTQAEARRMDVAAELRALHGAAREALAEAGARIVDAEAARDLARSQAHTRQQQHAQLVTALSLSARASSPPRTPQSVPWERSLRKGNNTAPPAMEGALFADQRWTPTAVPSAARSPPRASPMQSLGGSTRKQLAAVMLARLERSS